MPEGRVTQFVVEVLTTELSRARTTQFVVESAEQVTTTTETTSSTSSSTTTTTSPPPNARITHALAEVLRDGDPDARITHVVAEVLRGSYFRDLTNIAYHGAYPEVAYAGGELPRLFDSNPATFWMGTNSDDEGWVKFMFPEKEIVNAYQITARNDGYYQQTPGTWTFEASNTGAFGGEEVTLDSQSSVTWSQGQSRYYTFSNTTRYKFYRLNVTWTETTANLSCAELRIGDTNFTESTSSFSSFGSDVSSGETYSASSEYSGQYDHLAIDDTYNTFWAANNEMPCWWQIQFASQTQINKITIQARHDSYYYQAPVSFEVLASDTGSFGGEEVTLLSAQDCCENWAVSEIRTFIFANSTSYYYYRIDITDSGDGNNGAFAEIELMEGTSATTSTSSSTTASTTSTLSTTSSTGSSTSTFSTTSTTQTAPPGDWWTWLTDRINITSHLTKDGSWNTINVAEWVPAGTTAVLIQIMKTTASSDDHGYRPGDSTMTLVSTMDYTRINIAPIKLNSSYEFDYYIDSSLSVYWYIVGYTNDGTWFTDYPDYSSNPLTWTDVDLSSDLPAGTEMCWMKIRNNLGLNGEIGIRKNGTSFDAMGDVEPFDYTTAGSGVDSSRYIEANTNYSGSYWTLRLIGGSTLWKSLDTEYSYEMPFLGYYNWGDLHIDCVPPGTTMIYGYFYNPDTQTSYAHIRENGSTDTPVNNTMAYLNGGDIRWAFCGLDEDRRLEYFVGSGNAVTYDLEFVVVGYYHPDGVESDCYWNDDFLGDDDDPPDTDKWIVMSDDGVHWFTDIQSNQLRLYSDGYGTPNPGVKLTHALTGNFDVQVDFEIISATSASYWSLGIRLYRPTGGWYYNVFRQYRPIYGDASYIAWQYEGGAWQQTHTSTSDTYGKLRIKRSSNSFTWYYWNNSTGSWTQLRTNYGTTDNLQLQLVCESFDTGPPVNMRLDNFIMTEGCLADLSTTSSSTASTTSTLSTTSSTASSTSTMSSTSTFSTTSSTASSSSTSSTASSSSTTTTPPPEYWHTDFREQEVDQSPDGWTEQWHPTSGVPTIRDDGSLGSNCLEIVCSDERYGLSWDQVGLQDDPEILVKVRARANVDVVGYAVLRGSGTGDGGEQAYYACLYASSDRVYIRKYVAGSSQTITYYTMTVDTNTWYWMRFRILGNDLKLRVWEDGDAEPGTWQLEVTDTDISGDGWVGVGTFYNGPDYDYISVASNGGTALLPSATTTTSTVTSTTSTTHTYTGSTTTMSSTSSTASTTSTFSTTSSTMSSTSTQSTTSSSSSSTTTTFPPCFWNDDFTQDDGAPSRLKWTDDSSGTGYITVESNRLHVINGGGGTNTGTATCNATFSGDFTIEVDLEAVLAPFENSWSARLQALIDSSNYIWVDMHFEEATDSWTVGYRKAAPEKYPDSVSRTNDYGSLRIVRTGSVFYTYYKDGTGSWTEINSGGQNIGSGDVTISFDCVSWEFAANFEIAWDNFLVDYWGCPESVTTTTSSTTSSSTTTVTESTTSSTATSTSSTASTTSTFSTTSSTASTTSTFSTTSSTVSTVSTSSTTFSFTTTTFSGTTTTAPPPPDTQTTTMVVVTTG